MKKIYIASPMRGNFIENKKKAKYYSRVVYRRGYFPVCPQIYIEYATGLSEDNGDREEILKLGLEMLKMCDELWYFGLHISEGMLGEIKLARKLKIPVIHMKYI